MWPSVGLTTRPTRPGWTRTKLETAKATTTGVPFPITASFEGERMVKVGLAAATGGLAIAMTSNPRRASVTSDARLDTHPVVGLSTRIIAPPASDTGPRGSRAQAGCSWQQDRASRRTG